MKDKIMEECLARYWAKHYYKMAAGGCKPLTRDESYHLRRGMIGWVNPNSGLLKIPCICKLCTGKTPRRIKNDS